MTEIKHTPAPWIIREARGDFEIGYVSREVPQDRRPTQPFIALVKFGRSGAKRGCAVRFFKNETDAANAHLISASPDLLAALERMLDHAERHNTLYESGEDGELLEQVRAAIAKAKGAHQ
jgi:hypothetical protein